VLSAEGDTLAQIQTSRRREEPPIMLEEARIGIVRFKYFDSQEGLLYVPGRGFLMFDTARPELRWFDLDGRLSGIVRLGMERAPVTDADRSAVLESLQRSIDEAEEERDRLLSQALRDHAAFADLKPIFSYVRVDEDGYYWLQGNPDYSLGDDFYQARSPNMVLSPEGEYLGDTLFPELRSSVSRGHLLTTVEDEQTGEMDFIVYQIVSAVEGFTYP
jgi:hypothetical protein